MCGCFLGHCLYVMMYPFHHWGDYQLLVCNSWMLIIWQPPESLLSAITRPLAEAGDDHQSLFHNKTKYFGRERARELREK